MQEDNRVIETILMNGGAKSQEQSNMSIEDRLNEIASNITTVEGWEEYIGKYHPEFCRLLAKQKMKQVSSNIDESRRPIAIITGGQPGAGKSMLLPKYQRYLKENFGIDAVLNNADFYRFCVPGSYRIAEDFPESASRITDPVVKTMRKNLIQEAIDQKQSIIVENTLGDTIMLDMLQQSGTHDILIALMAVPREESLLSDFERYIKMKDSCDVARLVSIEAHDKRFYALDQIIKKIEGEGVRLLVHSRGKTENDFPITEYDSFNSLRKTYPSTMEAVRTIRARTYRIGRESYQPRVRLIRKKMTEYGMTPEEANELEELEGIINLSVDKECEESRSK